MNNVEETVLDIAKKILCEKDIELSSNLIEDAFADDLDVIEIFMEVEKKFKISLFDSDLPKSKTPQDIVDLVKQQQ